VITLGVVSDVHWKQLVERIASDLKFVLRSLARSPLFVVVAVLSLALGIGANSAIFSLLDQVLLRALPVKDPPRLVSMDWDGAFSGFMWNNHTFSYPMYVDFRDKTGNLFDGVIARFGSTVDLGWRGVAERTNAEAVSGNYFDVLGVGTVVGRSLTADDDKIKRAEPYVMLSYGCWQKRFGGNLSILNQTVEVNSHPMTVIGVAQRGFRGTDAGAPTDVFVPMMMKPVVTPTWDRMDERTSVWLNIMARLKPNVSRQNAQAAMTVLYRQEQLEDLKTNPNATPRFRKRYLTNTFMLVDAARGFSSIRDQFSTPLIVLMSMVGTLLLIACGNVANLLVARAATRQKEIAVRLSLGATAGAIVRLILIESLVLSITGGALGLLFASWSGSLLLRILPFETLAQVFSTTPDVRVLAFTFGLSVLTAVIFGFTPALQLMRAEIGATLKNEARSVVGSGSVKLRKGLVAAQISLSLLLLIGAGLFSRSLYNLLQTKSGMRTENMLAVSIDPALGGYSEQRARQLFHSLQQELSALPGALAVSGAENPVLADQQVIRSTQAEGHVAKDDEKTHPNVNAVLPGFFSAMGIPLLSGREFGDRDSFTTTKVAIVNESFVNQYFQRRNPLGRHIGFGSPQKAKLDMEIVGVVKDSKAVDLKQELTREVYTPALQNEHPSTLTFYIRTGSDANTMARLVRRMVRQHDSRLPVYDVKTLATQIRETHYVDRLISMLSAAFGFLATMLAAIGLYGVMAFSVTRRTRELGIRMALGAQRNTVLNLVMREVVLLAGIGVAVALPMALGLGRLLQTQLFHVKASDPATLAAATAVLVIVALVAGYIPALRATRIDPMSALRWE
jgi:predicted permease